VIVAVEGAQVVMLLLMVVGTRLRQVVVYTNPGAREGGWMG